MIVTFNACPDLGHTLLILAFLHTFKKSMKNEEENFVVRQATDLRFTSE